MAMVLLLFLLSCNTENAPDCFQTEGTITRKAITVPTFTKITVFEKLNLVLKEGPIQVVEVESGENLLNEITAEVIDDTLILRNENGCNIFRDYGISTVYITSPNVSVIRSSTGGLIKSDGVLTYANINLIAESFNNPEAETTDGTFDISVDNSNVFIIANGIAYFKINGETNNLSVNLAAGDSRVEAQDLIAANVNINHRATNDILVNPENQITGVIRSYGNVIAFNRPQTIDVEELFEGRLILGK